MTQIKSVEDVKSFFKKCFKDNASIHPDDDFKDYINYKTKEPFYTHDQAAKKNELMLQCFDVCEKEGIDIYDICLEASLKETVQDKFIPLQSLQQHIFN